MANPSPPTNPSPTSVTPNLSTLNAIRIKARRLTRKPSENELATSTLDDYINTFVLYDFPEQIRTFNFRTSFSFYCNTGQDVYTTDTNSYAGVTGAQTNPLYNFQNLYLTVHPPVYIAGYQALLSQSQTEFYGIYPLVNSIASIGVMGDGVTTTFSGVVNSAQATIPVPSTGFQQQISLLQYNVTFSSVDVNGNGTTLVDQPILDASTGLPTTYGLMYDPLLGQPAPLVLNAPYMMPPNAFPTGNFINYQTGVFTITFTNPPATGKFINSQTIPQQLSIPQAMLWYSNKFVLRPVPDQPYRINFEVFARPTALLSAGQYPELEEYWQYIAYGAARKILQDTMDLETVQLIDPEFREQEALCLRRTLVQYSNERTATIYTDNQAATGGYNGAWGWGGSNF